MCTMPHTRLWIVPLVSLLLSGCAGFGVPEPTPTSLVDLEPEVPQVLADGRVLPHTSAELRFLSPGLIAEILVHEGETVAAGQPLARLDSAELQSETR